MIDYEVEMQHLRFPMLHHMRGMVGVTEESFEAIAVVQNGEISPVQIFAELYDIPTDAAGLPPCRNGTNARNLSLFCRRIRQ